MKIAITFIALFISALIYGSNDENATNTVLSNEISSALTQQVPFSDFDLEGTADITFNIDINGILHIVAVATPNIFLKNHIIDSLDGKNVQTNGWFEGQTYSMHLKYIHSA